MQDDRVARLSEGQRECLRMVYRHMETKEIARSLGISPDGVTQRIKTAMRILGVHRRREAALILAEAESITVYPRRVHPPRDVATAPDQGSFAHLIGSEWRAGISGELREEQAAYVASTTAQTPLIPLPVRGARPNDVGWLTRLAWIAGIIIGIGLAFGALVAAIEALTRLIWG